jgi:hypothetical protein
MKLYNDKLTKWIITTFVCFSIIFLSILKVTYKGLSYFEWYSILASFTGATIGGIATLIALYVSTSETRKIQKKLENKDKEKDIELDKRKIKNAVNTFEKRVIGQYVDVLNKGNAYKELERKAESSCTEVEFIDVRNLFEEIQISEEDSYSSRYLKIKQFYDDKVYGQYRSIDFVFAKDYYNLTKDLGLDKEMERIRKEYEKIDSM